jgi:hypothetical protein
MTVDMKKFGGNKIFNDRQQTADGKRMTTEP